MNLYEFVNIWHNKSVFDAFGQLSIFDIYTCMFGVIEDISEEWRRVPWMRESYDKTASDGSTS